MERLELATVSRFAVVHAPSILGLRPTGVERLGDALESAGLVTRLAAAPAGRVEPPPYDPRRDEETGILNPAGLEDYSRRLADAVVPELRGGRFPIVLGGDCSNLIGCALALRRLGRFGLFFLDGHADFYQPEAEPNGEVASMDLAIVSGHGPRVLTDIEGRRPLVREEDIVAFGYRDAEEQLEHGSQDIRDTAIHVYPLDEMRKGTVAVAAGKAVKVLRESAIEGIWIHLDADVLDDRIMPAVDYRLPGGLSWEELSATLRAVMKTGKVVGLNVGIFNPALDPDGTIARLLVGCLVEGLLSPRHS
jgi:arginase